MLVFVYLCYIKFMYELVVVIQIELKDCGCEILNVENMGIEDNILQEIELFWFCFLFFMVVKWFNMNVSLFFKGIIFIEEWYYLFMFNVQFFVLFDSLFCDVLVYVVLEGKGVLLKYELYGK